MYYFLLRSTQKLHIVKNMSPYKTRAYCGLELMEQEFNSGLAFRCTSEFEFDFDFWAKCKLCFRGM